jgi:DNA-binding XRE family transcriptional regulator
MTKTKPVSERELAAIAKRFRMQAGIRRAQAARDMGVSQTSIFNAEENPDLPLLKLRVRMIEAYSLFGVEGPFFSLRRRKRTEVQSPATDTKKP